MEKQILKRPPAALRALRAQPAWRLGVLCVGVLCLLPGCATLPDAAGTNPLGAVLSTGQSPAAAAAQNSPRTAAEEAWQATGGASAGAPGVSERIHGRQKDASGGASDGPSNGQAQGRTTAETAAQSAAETAAAFSLADSANQPDTQRDLWDRVRSGFGLTPLTVPQVAEREAYYAARPEAVTRMTERAGRYLFHIVEEVERRKMPSELALLPFVESAFNPQALSKAQAAGMWQFIPSTGKDYALRPNVFRDDRRDVLASTRAALDYLARLNNLFSDWHLALAAYNWGEGNVKKAIARNEKAGLATDYASLRLPNETRQYVPKLLAIRNIVAEPERFGVSLAALRNHPYFISVPIERDIDVALAARLADIELEEFRHLNPQTNRPLIIAAASGQLLLPYDNAVQFTRGMEAHRGPLASWTAWVAPRTLKPAEAARLVGMSESALKTLNNIPPRMLVRQGSTLLVPRNSQRAEDVPEQLADNAVMALTPEAAPLRKLSHTVGPRGESVASVALRHKVSVAQLLQWNRLGAGKHLRPGTRYVVYVPNRTSVPRVAASKAIGKAGSPGAGNSKRPSARTGGLKLAER